MELSGAIRDMNTPSERSIPLPSRMYNPNVCPGLLTISTKLVMASGSWKTKEKKHFLKKGEKNIRNLDSFHEISEKKQRKIIFQNGPLAEVKKALKKKAIEIRICEYWGRERERKKPELPTKKARKWTLMEYMNHWRAGEEQCLENH